MPPVPTGESRAVAEPLPSIPPADQVLINLRALHASLNDSEKLVLGRLLALSRLREKSPALSFDFQPIVDQVNFFNDNGHLRVERITVAEEISRLQDLFAEILARISGPETVPEAQVDSTVKEPKVEHRRLILGRSGTIEKYFLVMQPELLYPELLDTMCFFNSRKVACAVLGIDETRLIDFTSMFSYKPPKVGIETPWHQEEAYWDKVEFFGNYVITWVPLDPASAQSGCLHFISRSHRRDVLRHRWESGKALVVDEPVDFSEAVVSPVAPGGATIHHCRTLHYSGPNNSSTPRRVWLMSFYGPSVRRDHPIERPWLAH